MEPIEEVQMPDFSVWTLFANISKSVMNQRLKFDPMTDFAFLKNIDGLDLVLGAHIN